MNFKKVESNKKFPEMEREILKFWEENKVFEKSLENRKDSREYTFYDGPPFATGTPHYGHIVANVMKDVVPRYWTMRGHYVERKWGWDCHGLPIENIVEKEMGSKKKKDIEEMGVDKFNDLCRSKVLTYVDEWEKVIGRLGRWADMKNAYRTMDKDYMESVWWVFKELWDKGLIYEDYRSMHICPRCETTLSQQEVSEGYKDIKDLSVVAKFELVDEAGTFVLAWTTTPWTLPGNVALAVGEDIDYVKTKCECHPELVSGSQKENEEMLKQVQHDNYHILAKSRLEEIFKDKEYQIVEEFKGKDLIGKEYKPLFDFYANNEKLENRGNGWRIYAGDFVTTEDGTGVVHIAPAFGEDDMRLGKENKLPFIQHVAMDGSFKEEMGELAGLNVKPIDNHQTTDIEIIKYLAKNGTLFSKEKYEHSYPHCWRCDTPLINYATSSWFVAVTKIKNRALELAKNINWSPAHMKEGRFGNWLEGARDWSISRQRFWASVMPIWVCDSCGEKKVFGGVEELEKLSGKKIDDLHKHIVDKITFKCEKCAGEMKRVSDVLDTWFDSGSMPYAQKHYPFENQKRFEENFPADFIAEGVDQTRAWFYYLHVIGTGIRDSEAFRNVIVNGIALAGDGKKMAKKLKNYPDPMEMLDKYGADSMRYYLMSSPIVAAQNLSFKEGDLSEVTRGMMRMLWNSYSFFVLYAEIDKFEADKNFNPQKLNGLLDKWIISELQMLIRDFNLHMENYELHKASRLLPKFVDNLSNWYIRRSRKRFWKPARNATHSVAGGSKNEFDEDKNEAYQTLYYVLVELSKLMAPFTPFISEEIYKNLTGEESVHLADFPVADGGLIDEKLNKNMGDLREVITLGLQDRAKNEIKVRQPLKRVLLGQKYSQVWNEMIGDNSEWSNILVEELNVKGSTLGTETDSVMVDTEITPELKLEGQAREIIRHIQELRKEAGYEVDNRITVGYEGMNEVFGSFGEMIQKEILADEIQANLLKEKDIQKEFAIDGEKLIVTLKR